MPDPDQIWADKMEALNEEGADIVKRSTDEALSYLESVLENIDDSEYRRIAVDTQAVEMGVGEAIMGIVAPIAKDMEGRRFKKGLKGLSNPDNAARMLRGIYLGRTIKNIAKEMKSRGDK